MCKEKMLETILADGLVPLFYHPDFEVAKEVVAACAAGGGHVVEVVNRGERALEVFSRLNEFCAKELPEMILGAGTIFHWEDAEKFIEAGAGYIVAPCFDAGVAAVCRERGVVYVPGVATPCEIHTALINGADICKVFPGECLGPSFVKAVKAVFPSAAFLVSGGVQMDHNSLMQWFQAGVDCVGMGSKLLGKERVEKGDFEGISRDVRMVLKMISEIRSGI